MNKQTITVSYVGKYGPSVNGEWFNLDGKSGLTPDQFEKGKTYDVLVAVSKTGKKYIQQIVGTDVPQAAPVTEAAAVEKPGDDKILHVKHVNTQGITVDRPTTKKETDWDGIARGKVACAMFQAALQSPGLAMYATSRAEYLTIVSEVAEEGIKFTWKHQKGE